MFGYYVRLRLRSGGRLLKELGIVRSVLLVGLLALAVAILCKVEASGDIVQGGGKLDSSGCLPAGDRRLSPDAEGQGLLAPVHR